MTPHDKRKKREQIPQGVRFDVFRRDNFECVYCGRGSPDVTIECDHRVAVSNGGTNDMSNLVTACFDCNRGKGAKTLGNKQNQKMTSSNDNSLVGMFGHRLNDEGHIQNQFRIIGMVNCDTCLIQLYSFLDGSATTVATVGLTDVCGPDFRLYTTERAFSLAYWEEKERRGLLSGKSAYDAYEMSVWVREKLYGASA